MIDVRTESFDFSWERYGCRNQASATPRLAGLGSAGLPGGIRTARRRAAFIKLALEMGARAV